MAISKEQYDTLAARRLATDGMLWQTPVLSLTAQAFLFTIALGSGITSGARLLSSILAFVAAICSMQLMAKHRYHELQDSNSLKEYENDENNKFKVIHGPREDKKKAWYLISSYLLWVLLLVIFAVSAIIVIFGVLASWEWVVGSAS